MKKASEFLDLWAVGPCQEGLKEELSNKQDVKKFWGDSLIIQKEKKEYYYTDSYLEYESELRLGAIRIFVLSNEYLCNAQRSMVQGEVRIAIIRNGFETIISSEHPLELANNVAAIIEMDVVKQEEEAELPF